MGPNTRKEFRVGFRQERWYRERWTAVLYALEDIL